MELLIQNVEKNQTGPSLAKTHCQLPQMPPHVT
jgi:hypothetical protein